MDDVLTLPELPDEESRSPELEPVFEPVIQCEARYEVDPIPGGKRFQGSWLVLDDGTRYVLSYRPVPEHYRYVDKRVIVTGRPYRPGRDTQHILATHFEVTSMELAPGEIPYTEIPTELPAPPLLRTAEEVYARDGRWGQIVGRLMALEDDPDTQFHNALLQLGDCTFIVARYAALDYWKPYMGTTMTVMSRIAVISSPAVSVDGNCGAVLTGWYALCPGEVKRCGMQDTFP
jgi:hypothetical protein